VTGVKKKINNLISILTVEQTQILNTALIAMIPVLFTKITGQLFYLLAASYFGTQDVNWQNFLLASTIPDFMSNVLIAGVIGGIVIPTLVTAYQKDGYDKFIEVFSTITNLVVIAIAITSIFIILLPTQTFSILYPEVSLDQSNEIINLMRMLLVPQIILAISVSISNALNIYHRYLIPQLAPLLFNLGKIIFLGGFFYINKLIVDSGAESIRQYSSYAIISGIYFGSILHLLIQIPLAWKLGIRIRPVLKLSDKYIRELTLISLPRLFALGSEHMALAVNRFISFNISGGIAALNFANSLSLVIPQLFAFTFAYASFTKLAEHFNSGENKEISEIVNKVFNQMIFLSLPFIIAIIVLRVPLVRLTYGILPNTMLSLEGTYQIAWVLLLFAVGHVFVLGKWFFQRIFYAGKNSVIPFVASVISLIFTIVLSILFTNLFSHNSFYSFAGTQLNWDNFTTAGDHGAAVGGIALAMSISYTIEFIFLFTWFHFKKIRLDLSNMFNSIVKKFIAGFMMFIVLYFIYKTWHVISDISINNYNRGSQLLNFLVVIPVILTIIFLSLRYLRNKITSLSNIYLKSVGITLLIFPIFVLISKFSFSSENFGYLYGIFTLLVSYGMYLFFLSILFKIFRSVFAMTNKGLKKNNKKLFVIFLTVIFSYIAINFSLISGSFVNLSLIDALLTSTTLNLILITGISLITAFMVYYLVCLLLKVEELSILKKYLNPLFRLGGLSI
jgi:putative peptidoglycan lipid II flippase